MALRRRLSPVLPFSDVFSVAYTTIKDGIDSLQSTLNQETGNDPDGFYFQPDCS